MYSKVTWKEFGPNVTLTELNNELVKIHIPAIAIIAVLMLIGVVGNILVLYIYTTKYHSSTHRCFILCLAGIDMISCCIGMPLLIYSMSRPYLFVSVEACKVFRFLHVFLVVSSAFVVIAIAIERHRRICNPFNPALSTKKVKIACTIAMFLGGLVAIPALLVYAPADNETGVQNITGKECFTDAKYIDSSFPMLYFSAQLLLTVLSFAVLAVLYIRIGKQIWWHQSFMRDNTIMSVRINKLMKNVSAKPEVSKNSKSVYQSSNEDTTQPIINSKLSNKNGDIPDVDNCACQEDSHCDHSRIKERKDSNSSFQSEAYLKRNNKGKKNKARFANETQADDNSKPREDRKESCSSQNAASSVKTKRVTTMLFIITVVFILSFLPHLVLMVMMSLDRDFINQMSPAGIAVCAVLLRTFVVNNMANAIIYGFCDRKFRDECKYLALSLVCCYKCRTD